MKANEATRQLFSFGRPPGCVDGSHLRIYQITFHFLIIKINIIARLHS